MDPEKQDRPQELHQGAHYKKVLYRYSVSQIAHQDHADSL